MLEIKNIQEPRDHYILRKCMCHERQQWILILRIEGLCVTGIGAPLGTHKTPCRQVWEKLSRRAKMILLTQG
jgi:hypothetical protein